MPLYYAKPDGKLPIAWLRLMRESMLSVTPVYNTHRMVKEYQERLYDTAAKAYHALSADSGKAAAALSEWKNNRMRRDWPQIRIRDVQLAHADRHSHPGRRQAGAPARRSISAGWNPSEVSVQAYYGEKP